MTIDWHFEEQSLNDVDRNPISEEFFSSSNTLTDLSSLVRESIQNSLDAQLDGSPSGVKVVFTVSEIDVSSVAERYFASLDEHLEAALTASHQLPTSGPCRFLVVEDFGTTGLLGSVTATSTEARNFPKQNSYRYFAWTNGSSPKDEGRRGKWGVGKVVFPKISSIKTFFAYSIRLVDGQPDCIVFGQSVLKTHDLHNKPRNPDGWWGRKNTDDRSVPLGAEVVPQFATDWQVKRTPGQPGLSIVVPFIDESFTAEAIASCVLHDYFISLADGSLVVEIYDQNSQVVLDASCIRDHIESLPAESPIRLVAGRYLDHCDSPLEAISITAPTPINRWNEVDIPEDERASWRERLDNGETLLFKIPTRVARRTDDTPNGPLDDEFEVFLTAAHGVREKPMFCREGILIPNAAHHYVHDYVALALIRPGKLADLLGSAEGPAHERWSDQGDKFKDKYVSHSEAKEVLSWVRGAPEKLVRMLRIVEDGRDDYQLGKFFPMPGESGNRGPRANSDVDQESSAETVETTEPVLDLPPQEPAGISVRKSDSGFRICSNAHTQPNTTFRIQVAYALRRGNPFTKWMAADFELESLRSGGQTNCIYSIVDNSISLTSTGGDFELRFEGFDPLRDLVFDVEQVTK